MSPDLRRPLPSELEGLYDLALDLGFTGSRLTDSIWERLDLEMWERTSNPYIILENVSQARLEEAAQDETLKRELSIWLEGRRRALEEECWFSRRYPKSDLKGVAYFSMEFGLSEALPIYSGGLGILAGDHLKTASDLGVPMVGVGLLYQQGYFRQIISEDGSQIEAFPYNDPTTLPIFPVQSRKGGRLRVRMTLPGRTLFLRVWQVQVGRVPLYLLDSNDPLNSPWDRAITANLYHPGQERRLIQEMVLGIGGWLALEEMGIEVDVCHINEGHAALVVLARAHSLMQKTGLSFSEALWATRAGNVFTTHTPVSAGFDRFQPALVKQYLQPYVDQVGISHNRLLALGRDGNREPTLNMACLAVRGSAFVNGVSRLHGQVSRRIFQDLFPRWPEKEVPIDYVTNGIHIPTWDSTFAYRLWCSCCGEGYWLDPEGRAFQAIPSLKDSEIWSFRVESRRSLVEYVRRQLARQLQQHGAPSEHVRRADHVLDLNALTLGFARRFAAYKRPTLMLQDPDRLTRLLLDKERPVQLIVAGKTHPSDGESKDLVRAMVKFASRPELSDRVVFLEDYDIGMAQKLVAGVDLWINTPRRGMEACGTSGMKVLVNGGLNLSELDGWWDEGYTPEVGWALGDREEHHDPDWDRIEADCLYRLIEGEIIPDFYQRDGTGIPRDWIRRLRASMSRLTPQFSSHRMMMEYNDRIYIPAAAAYHRRTADGSRLAKELMIWQKKLAEGWQGLRISGITVNKVGDFWEFQAQVYLGNLDPQRVMVELYADPLDDEEPVRIPMAVTKTIPGAVNDYYYEAFAPLFRPAEHYTPRIIPYHPDATIPLEENHILWPD